MAAKLTTVDKPVHGYTPHSFSYICVAKLSKINVLL